MRLTPAARVLEYLSRHQVPLTVPRIVHGVALGDLQTRRVLRELTLAGLVQRTVPTRYEIIRATDRAA